MPKTHKNLFLLILGVWLAMAQPVQAAEKVERLGVYRHWIAYTHKEKGNKICYIATRPTKEEGKYSRRGDVAAFITHRPYLKELDQVSFAAGYDFRPKSNATLWIDNQKFELFTHADRAWAPDEKMDQTLVKSMIKGTKMVVYGLSERGTKTKDTYSLLGFTDAYKKATQSCGLKTN